MSVRATYYGPPIMGAYAQAMPNEPIAFGEFDLRVLGDAHPHIGNIPRCRIVQTFGADEQLNVHVPFVKSLSLLERLELQFGASRPLEIAIGNGDPLKLFVVSMGDKELVCMPERTPIQLKPQSTNLDRVIFQLYNWPNFRGEDFYTQLHDPSEQHGGTLCGVMSLTFGKWWVQIFNDRETKRKNTALQSQGGYMITHVGCVSATTAETFSSEEIENVLSFLQYLFTFALGRWSGPQMAVGYSKSGDCEFQHLGLGQCAPGRWLPNTSWFSDTNAEILAGLAPMFWDAWCDPILRKAITSGVYWYASANTLGKGVHIDSALLFTQAAMELLAWTYCTQYKQIAPESDFGHRGRRASDKFKMLAKALNIPVSIPPAIKSFAAKPGPAWEDAMHAITDIRNQLTHPGKQGFSTEIYYDAWRLSLWYLDLVILRMVGYDGKYRDRLSGSRSVVDLPTS